MTAGSDRPRHAARHRHPARHSPRRALVRVTSVVAAVASFALLCGFGYGWYQYRSLTGNLHQVDVDALQHHPTAGGRTAPAVHGTEMNILVTGIDSRSGLSSAEQSLLHVGHEDSLSTDTIMIIHVPADGSKATLISIPRDSFVAIPGYQKNKINAAYGDAWSDAANSGASEQEAESKGFDLLVRTVENLTGIDIDHNIQVGFGGFYTITKAVGGLPVNLCRATDDTIAANLAANLGRTGSGFHATAGHHDLTPLQAFQFVRQRHFLPHNDLDRERRQQYFLAAAFKKMASAGVLLSPTRLNALIKAFDGAVTVDTGLADELPTLAKQFSDLSAGNIKGYTIPTLGPGNDPLAGNVERVDPAAVRARVNAILAGRFPAPKPRPSSSASSKPSTSTSAPAAPTEQKCIN